MMWFNPYSFILGFIVGTIVGYMVRSALEKVGYYMQSNSLNFKTPSSSNMVAFAVTLVWVMSMVAEMGSTTYQTSPLVHGLMGVIAGFYFKPFAGGNHEK